MPSCRRPSACAARSIFPPRKGEREALEELREIMSHNKVFRSFIGQGYYDTITPPVIQRNILENPGWYTAYTPYQAEIAQGRLEALLNFQTMVADLTGLDIANASLLDEATAAAEAMTMLHAVRVNPAAQPLFRLQRLPSADARRRPHARGAAGHRGRHRRRASSSIPTRPTSARCCNIPARTARFIDYTKFIQLVHQVGGKVAMATDLLALTLLKPPGEFGADVALGSAQRFGVPLGYGGPHAAFFATKDELKRHMPGRLIGVSHDAQGKPAMRLALQTREQHIRRDKATSNICTAQVLLAVMASMYAVYHGPEGLRDIAERVHRHDGASRRGAWSRSATRSARTPFFDTLRITTSAKWSAHELAQEAVSRGINLRVIDADTLGISLDETDHRGRSRSRC